MGGSGEIGVDFFSLSPDPIFPYPDVTKMNRKRAKRRRNCFTSAPDLRQESIITFGYAKIGFY
jgi:hypothetical protein